MKRLLLSATLMLGTLTGAWGSCALGQEAKDPASVSGAAVEQTALQSETAEGPQKVFSEFIQAHESNKRGMVIGRGNVQGIAEERITIPELKNLSWLFVDPGDAGDVGYLHDNAQDTSQGNALATTWPVIFSTRGAFDAVVIDYGTLPYFGNDGVVDRLGQEYFSKQMALVIAQVNGAKISKTSFAAPCLFQGWILKNRPAEFLPLEAQYWPLIQAEEKKQRQNLEKGLLDAYLALRRGGVLIIPIDGSISRIDFVNLLSISGADLVRHSIINGDCLAESPVLPQIRKGMGAWYGDYYSIVRK